MKFSEFELCEPVMAGVRDAGFTECTEVQTQTLTHTLAGRDVCVQSQTGTGKTAAYLISVFELMYDNQDFHDRITMIIAPTRELAVQIEKEAKLLGSHLPLRIGSFYGGVGYGEQERLLAEGVDVVIGTPGRLLDFGDSGKLDFRRVGIVIIDEADRLFDMGFYPDLRRMLKKMPSRENRISMLYSATLNVRARNIAWEHMHEPVEVEINPEQITVEAIDQRLYHVSRAEKFRLLLGILKHEDPAAAIIFTNTKRAAEEISERLSINGHESTFIMGDLPQRKRLRIIEDIKARRVRLLVATDVAARGLHIDDLDLVVNYDIPEDRESYVHRIGRTARAGKSGRAVSIADEQYVFGLEAIEEFLGHKIPSEQVSDDLLEEDKSAGMRIRVGGHAGGRSGGSRGEGRRGSRTSGGRRGAPASSRGGRGRSDGPTRSTGPARAGRTGRDDAERTGAATARQQPGDGGYESASRSGGRRESGGPGAGGGHGQRGGRGSGAGRSAGGAERHSARSSSRPGDSNAQRHPGKQASMEERIAYYQEKYGEDFEGVAGRSADSGRSQDRSRKPESERTGEPAGSSGRSRAPGGGSAGSQTRKSRPGGADAPTSGTRSGQPTGGGRSDVANGPSIGGAAPANAAGAEKRPAKSIGERISGLFRRIAGRKPTP